MFQADYTPPPGAATPGGGAGGSGGDDRQVADGDIGGDGDGGEEELGEPEPAVLPDGTPNPNAGKRKRYLSHPFS